jgi:isopentenyldiphosphate isomerase
MCPFTVWRSQSRVPAAAFSTAINNFSRDFLAQMRTRSQAILDNGWTGAACTIDPAGLLREQEDRERIAAHAYTPPKTDWDNVRRMLDVLGL